MDIPDVFQNPGGQSFRLTHKCETLRGCSLGRCLVAGVRNDAGPPGFPPSPAATEARITRIKPNVTLFMAILL